MTSSSIHNSPPNSRVATVVAFVSQTNGVSGGQTESQTSSKMKGSRSHGQGTMRELYSHEEKQIAITFDPFPATLALQP
jgi:hypothetical protein